MRLCLYDCASANKRDGSSATHFFQATQHGVSSFGEKWLLLNGHTELEGCRLTAELQHNSSALLRLLQHGRVCIYTVCQSYVGISRW